VSFLNRLHRSRTAASILDRELLVLTPDSGDEDSGTYVLEEERDFPIILVTGDDGLAVLPAFTSEAALLRWRPEGSRFLGLQGRVVIEMLSRSDWDRIVVDTNSRNAFLITRTDAVELLHQ
jgi:hypothetical protein